MNNKLKNSTVIITGSSRGIGREIALKCASEGANVVITGKTIVPHSKLNGTIYTVADEINNAGGKAIAIPLDVRDYDQIKNMVKEVIDNFKSIDILVNNAGAIKLTRTDLTSFKQYNLMQDINTRAAFLCSKECLPYLKESKNAHILNMSPPISLDPIWLSNHVAYTISKYGMSLATIGMAEEFSKFKINVNSLWPKTAINTAAISMLLGDKAAHYSRSAKIIADAAYRLFIKSSLLITGKLLIDEDFLREEGITDFSEYSLGENDLYPDLFVGSPDKWKEFISYKK